MVFLAAGNRHTPGWNWVWKAYRSLSRKYRKNLKRLVRKPSSALVSCRIPLTGMQYVVHSNFFTKSKELRPSCDSDLIATLVLFSLAGAIIRYEAALCCRQHQSDRSSPKFFRKITYINTLSELAYHVPLTQIDIPPPVYQSVLFWFYSQSRGK